MTLTAVIQRLDTMIEELIDQNDYYSGRVNQFNSISVSRSNDDEIMHYKAKIKRNKKDIDYLNTAKKVIMKEKVKEL